MHSQFAELRHQKKTTTEFTLACISYRQETETNRYVPGSHGPLGTDGSLEGKAAPPAKKTAQRQCCLSYLFSLPAEILSLIFCCRSQSESQTNNPSRLWSSISAAIDTILPCRNNRPHRP